MSGLKLDISIDSTTFQEIGTPYDPSDPKSAKDLLPNFRGALRAEYESFTKSTIRALSNIREYMSKHNFTCSGTSFSCSFDYKRGVENTYKFLGMDINSDYQAVIPVGDGYVIVAEMFDSAKVISSDPYDLRRFDPQDINVANNLLKTCSAQVFRKLSTAMKTGALYDLYKSASKKSDRSVEISDLLPMINLVKDEVQYGGDSEEKLSFNSILLNLIHEAKKRDTEITGRSGDDSQYANVAVVMILKLFDYWNDVIKEYNGAHEVLSEVDLWQSIYKKFIGEDEFNRRARKCINLIDDSTGEVQRGMASVSGVARNGDLLDADTFRQSASNALTNLGRVVAGRTSIEADDLNDLMLGNIDYEKFDNPYDLTQEEVQAMSNYDSLQNIDEDADTCMDSYDMDDPEERGLYMKSAIRSYERNFKAYKPKENYDVTNAMSEMIERGDRFRDRIVSDETYDGEDTSVYVVTSKKDEIKLGIDKKTLLKVSKMLDKQLIAIDKMF